MLFSTAELNTREHHSTTNFFRDLTSQTTCCVTPNDCDALRFLWWPNNDLKSEPEEYQMMVHLFGTTSSPSCPNFGLWQTAEDNCQEFSKETVDSVKDNFYVDDCLKSVPSKTKTIGLIW